MKKIIASITVLGLVFSHGVSAQDNCEPKVYYDETDDCFNKGKFVGRESEDYLKSIQRAQRRNWAVAFGTVAVGALTLVLVGVNHKHDKSH
ncbi:MAG: hypothetical protein JSS30_04405 [Verrucomicrobia bacterium]|nr:hypothetical protein [Verrucomicrobiota bacterium]